eukprot:1631114-Lingulodinium_polyedra.AAC.1
MIGIGPGAYSCLVNDVFDGLELCFKVRGNGRRHVCDAREPAQCFETTCNIRHDHLGDGHLHGWIAA